MSFRWVIVTASSVNFCFVFWRRCLVQSTCVDSRKGTARINARSSSLPINQSVERCVDKFHLQVMNEVAIRFKVAFVVNKNWADENRWCVCFGSCNGCLFETGHCHVHVAKIESLYHITQICGALLVTPRPTIRRVNGSDVYSGSSCGG